MIEEQGGEQLDEKVPANRSKNTIPTASASSLERSNFLLQISSRASVNHGGEQLRRTVKVDTNSLS